MSIADLVQVKRQTFKEMAIMEKVGQGGATINNPTSVRVLKIREKKKDLIFFKYHGHECSFSEILDLLLSLYLHLLTS